MFKTIPEYLRKESGWHILEKVGGYAGVGGALGMGIGWGATSALQQIDPLRAPQSAARCGSFVLFSIYTKCILDGVSAYRCKKNFWGDLIAKKLAYENSVLVYTIALVANLILRVGGPAGDGVCALLLVLKLYQLYEVNASLSNLQRMALRHHVFEPEILVDHLVALTERVRALPQPQRGIEMEEIRAMEQRMARIFDPLPPPPPQALLV